MVVKPFILLKATEGAKLKNESHVVTMLFGTVCRIDILPSYSIALQAFLTISSKFNNHFFHPEIYFQRKKKTC